MLSAVVRRCVALASLFALGLVACQSPSSQAAASRPASAPAPAAAGEASVRPGINKDFLDDRQAAESFLARFEVESREIYAHRGDIAARVGLTPGQRVADVGAGTGLFLKPFADAVGRAGRVFAVELAPKFVAMLGERARREGLDQVTVVQCREDSVELPEGGVDVVFVCDTYHHFEYPLATLRSIHRALRPGGQLVVVDFIRIPGVSRQWVLDHVRAGQEVFAAEIEAAGFQRAAAEPMPFLSENYLMRFTRP